MAPLREQVEEISDEVLLSRLQAGEQELFVALIRRYEPTVDLNDGNQSSD